MFAYKSGNIIGTTYYLMAALILRSLVTSTFFFFIVKPKVELRLTFLGMPMST